MDIKLFPEIGGEDGIWIDYQEGLMAPLKVIPEVERPPTVVLLAVPTWSELFMLVKLRVGEDWKALRKWVKSKWSSIWHT